MKRRLVLFLLLLALLPGQAAAEDDYIKWVEFSPSCGAMEQALAIDLQTHEQEKHIRWTQILALASVYHGDGNVSSADIRRAAQDLQGDQSPRQRLGERYRYYDYYLQCYEAALGGLVGSYAILVTDDDGSQHWKPQYGLKAFSPIAAGYWYSHYDDFGASRSYGFARRHLGNDLMGSLGTPICAVETGTVEAMGWNQYGGWRVGIRSLDRKRYYYYAHLRKDAPFAPGLQEGDRVNAGDVIGFMGRTGYSTKENVNNIETVHLHFGLELIFDERQKECDNEIWIDVYQIVRLLERHRSSVQRDAQTGAWSRIYAWHDLDAAPLPPVPT